jgi:hypothetical protein
MTISRSLSLLAVALGAAVAEPVITAHPAAAAVELLSHRAAYRLSLAEGSSATGGVAAVRGGLVIEWRDSCAGAISNQRLGFIASLEEGGDSTYDVRFSSWESPDNKQLRFTVRSFDDGYLYEEFRGEATLDDAGAGHAAFSEPPGEELALPQGTLFPSEHLRQLIIGAERGEVVISHEVFDGSGPEGLSRVTAVIGKSRAAPVDGDESGKLRWPVTLAYHEAHGADDMPVFEIAFQLSDRGVMHDLVLDYGDFTLEGELEQLDTFAAPECQTDR